MFLDEIGDMPPGLQAKLLRVLQDHNFERVGGTKPIRADLRVVAATNRDLDQAAKEGRFREDLFYRLNVVRITLPPLRDRKEDLPVLAQHLVAKFAAETKKPVRGLSAQAMARVQGHTWPGNVRELANVIERAVVLCAGDDIQVEDLAVPNLVNISTTQPPTSAGNGDFHSQVRESKRQIIRAALDRSGGNQTKAAELLGLQHKHYIFMAISSGTVKKTSLENFSRPRTACIIAVDLREDDLLVDVALTDGSKDIMLLSSAGKAVHFAESAVRPMGRTAAGVRGIKLGEGHKVIGLIVVDDEASILTATENGYGKRTVASDYPCKGRGTQGVISIQTSERNGTVIGAVQVKAGDEIMLISNGGTLVRTSVDEVRDMGRNTQGVMLIRLSEGEKLVEIERVECLEGEEVAE